MASHSISSGKNRRTIIYPKHLFLDKQAKEAKDREKEREKLMIKLKDVNFSPIIPENPISTRDQLMKECWAEIKGLPKPVFDNVWQGPIEVRVEELKVKMKKFEEKAEKLQVQYNEELKKKESEMAAKIDKKKAAKETKTAAAATTTPAPVKTVLNPNFVKIEGGESANQGSEKKQP
jgi:hypothetical protein